VQPKWKIHKFGGTSVLNAERYQNVYKILSEKLAPGLKAIVVSAMKGVTDDLIQAVQRARTQQDYKTLLQQVHDRHVKEISKLVSGPQADRLQEVLKQDFQEVSEILRGVWLTKEASESIFARISGLGEVWSAQILNAYLKSKSVKAEWLDARQVLVVKNHHQQVLVDWEKSQVKLNAWVQAHPSCENIVITGFVAALEDGSVTTLGRNGSDYSASIFGALLNCDEIFIWTDVDGVLSADPQQIPEAIVLSEMSYNEVTELAYFGAKVVHPSTMTPAVEKNIPIWIKNTFNPDFHGTKICRDSRSDGAVKGFSTIHHMALLNMEGTGMIGIPGVAERVFGALRNARVNVVLISQASSEQSICVAVTEEQAGRARAALEESFAIEIQKGIIKPIQVTQEVSILAAVGDNMAHSPGISGRLFTALGQCGVNVRAIAQGSSERNISVVIDSKDAVKALRTVHSSFILPHQVISIGLIGPGLIGKTFLQQLHENRLELRDQRKVDFQVRAIADSKKMYLSEGEIPLDRWQELLKAHGEPIDFKKFAEHIHPSHIPHALIVESTASSALVPFYEQWLTQGIHIISPNKQANTASMQDYRRLRATAQKARRHFLYSTNVGAGLPVIQTLRDLSNTGDKIFVIQGILSGTLSFIFNQFDGRQPFSQIVQQAKTNGFTEPDPREDLSGQDVVRKIVILAREAGLQMEVSDVRCESLVPENLRSISREEFMSRIAEMDQAMDQKIKLAQSKNQILRFVATLNTDGKASVGLESLDASHVFSKASGTDNVVLFQTRRYFKQALVIQGPGAGPEVTAAGVFADLLRLSQYLGSVT
jgi:aspartokinase/homoserine dehydrogenase 1